MREIFIGLVLCLPVIFIAVCTFGLLDIFGGDEDESDRSK